MTAQEDASKVRAEVLSSQTELEKFSDKLAEVDQTAASAVEQTTQLRDDIDNDVGHQSRQFVQRLQKEKLARQASTHDLLSKTQESMVAMAAVLDGVERLEKKVTATVTYHLGTLDLEDEKSGRQLRDALELEQYTDDKALEAVVEKLNHAKELEAQLARWRHGADGSATKFQGLVNAEFSDLGHDLDLSKLEMAEEAAMERWAVQNQMSDLKDHLGHEVQDLTAASQKRLADLAAASAKQIAALKADESLSEHERAQALAKIKADAKARASKILEDDGRLALDQQTAARHLDAAVTDVEETTGRLAGLESATRPAPGVTHVLDRIHDLLDEAKENLFDDAPPAVGSVVGLSSAPSSELERQVAQDEHARAAVSSLADLAPAGTAAAIVAEDADLERLLDSASSRMP